MYPPSARGDESKEVVEAGTRQALKAARKYSLIANSAKSEIVISPEISVVECEASQLRTEDSVSRAGI